MLSYQVLHSVKHHFRGVVCQRNIGIFAPLLQKAPTDPIQKLFLDKIREYKQKGGTDTKLVDPTPEIERELKTELERVSKIYGGGEGVDMTAFPTFKFTDPPLDPINIADVAAAQAQAQPQKKTDAAAAQPPPKSQPQPQKKTDAAQPPPQPPPKKKK